MLNESLLAWLEVVYHTKVHAETGQAPLERYRQDEIPSIRSVDPTDLRQAFLHRDQRKVTKTATFSFQNNRYRVADYLRRQTVELRYAPFDLSRLEVWFQNTFLQIAELDRLVTTIHPDVEPDPIPLCPARRGTRLPGPAAHRAGTHAPGAAPGHSIHPTQPAGGSQ